MARPLFSLGPRLAQCAAFVRRGTTLCDVGTDHAYLPIWLLKQNLISRAVACDLRPGPLENAAADARRYRVQERLSLRLGDGLSCVGPEDAEDIVLAGMGGDLILRIIAGTPWLLDTPGKRLICQPMTAARGLREGLTSLGFALREERAVEDAGRVYSVFWLEIGQTDRAQDPAFPWTGGLQPGDEAAQNYAQRALADIGRRLEGARRGRGPDSEAQLLAARGAIRERFGIE